MKAHDTQEVAVMKGERKPSVSDIIVQVNNQMVYNEQMLSDALRLRNQNNKISIQVLRGDRLITLHMDGVL